MAKFLVKTDEIQFFVLRAFAVFSTLRKDICFRTVWTVLMDLQKARSTPLVLATPFPSFYLISELRDS